MATYSVLEPPDAPADRMASAERLAFIRDGFAPYAAALPPVWMLAKRMWIEFGIYMGLAASIAWFFTAIGHATIGNAVLLILQILFGFEAGILHAASLERRGWRLVGSVDGRNREDCERRFFEAWLPTYTTIPAPAARPPAPSNGNANSNGGSANRTSANGGHVGASDAATMTSLQRHAAVISPDAAGVAGSNSGSEHAVATTYPVPSWTNQAVHRARNLFMRGCRALQGT